MQTNDYVSTSTTDLPGAAKAAGANQVVKENETELKADESGETAEIKAQDAVETDQDTEADDKDVDAGDDDQEEKTEEEKAKPKKKGGFQKKLEKKDREIEFLREQIARQQQPQPQKEVEKAVNNDQKPKIDEFDSQADYLEALTDWKVEQKVKERDQKAQQESVRTEYENRITKFQKQGAEFAESVDDYADVIDDVSDVMISPGLQEALLESENGPEILYNLAKNKDELMRINRLNLVAQAKEIGKLEATLAKSEEKKPEVKTKTTAPPPPKPVGTKSPGKVVKDPSDMDFEEYKVWRAKNK